MVGSGIEIKFSQYCYSEINCPIMGNYFDGVYNILLIFSNLRLKAQCMLTKVMTHKLNIEDAIANFLKF